MAYILNAQRSLDVCGAFARYRQYLEGVQGRMPSSAHGLATSDWYFDFSDHRCPHDARLKSVTISESPVDKDFEEAGVSIRIRLLGAYQDGIIELHYPNVIRYHLAVAEDARGHQDWRYDELRLSDEGLVIHEIEWSGAYEAGRWIIEATDLEYAWVPIQEVVG